MPLLEIEYVQFLPRRKSGFRAQLLQLPLVWTTAFQSWQGSPVLHNQGAILPLDGAKLTPMGTFDHDT